MEVSTASAPPARRFASTTRKNGDSMPSSLAHRIYHQVIQFLLIAFYLFIVFGVLVLHEEVVAAKNGIAYHFYGFAALNAIILGKVMLVGEDLDFANRFFRNILARNGPLIYVIVFKSIAFTLLFFVFDIVEEIIVGAFKGKTVYESFPNIGGGTPRGIISMIVVITVLLIPFFAYREIARRIGERELHMLLFGRVRP
jgi:hypothetical protein